MARWEFEKKFFKGEFQVHLEVQYRDCDNDQYRVRTFTNHWEKSKQFDNEEQALQHFDSEVEWIRSLFVNRR